MKATTLLDLRPLSDDIRFPKVFEAFDRLKLGESVELLNDHDPRPLYYRMLRERAGQFRWHPLLEGPDRWEISLERTKDGTGERDGFPSIPSSAAVLEKPAWIGELNPGDEVFLDVRPLIQKGLEPYPFILKTAGELRGRQYLRLVNFHEPVFLYSVMGEMGFDHYALRQGGAWNIYFRRKP